MKCGFALNATLEWREAGKVLGAEEGPFKIRLAGVGRSVTSTRDYQSDKRRSTHSFEGG
mgnify:CR=1 FL=1